MSARPVRICLIGAGRHSSDKLYPNLRKVDGLVAVANADLDVERARAVGRLHGIEQHYADWREMVERERPEGVIICIKDSLHAELAAQALELGCHVFTEKPHAASVAGSRKALEAARRNGRICMAGYKKRYAPAYNRAHQILASEDFGGIGRLHVQRSMGGHDKKDRGYLWQWGCHVIDLVGYLAGQPEELLAWRTSKEDNDWRSVSVLMRFPHGGIGELVLGSPGGNWEEVVVQGSGMHALRCWDSIFMDRYSGNTIVDGVRPSFHAQLDGDVVTGFTGELQAFAEAIRTGRQPPSNIAESTRTVALYEAIIRSLDSRAIERVEQIEEVCEDLQPVEAQA